MHYVEMLRARRVLLWYAGVLLACMILTVIGNYANVSIMVSSGGVGNISATTLAAGCGFGAWIVTTFVASGLNTEIAMTPIVWTRPVRRETIAWRYVAVDVVGILIGYAVLVTVLCLFFASFGALGAVTFDAKTPVAVALAVGSALMWYGLILLATARLPGRGAMVAGLSWGVAFALLGLWAIPMPLLHAVVHVLNFVNPLAWFGDLSVGARHHADAIIPLPDNVRAMCVWAIAAATTAAGVRLWATREV